MLKKLALRLFAVHAPSVFLDLRSSHPDKAAEICAEWLNRNADQKRLAERWYKLEAFLIREHDLFQLNEQERALFIEAVPLDLIDSRIIALHAVNKKLLGRISKSHATTAHGLLSKLRVALELVPSDENKDAHLLLRSVLQDIEPRGFE
tara:strand:+ start:822 stop:1268 length:447 start_codon:yes stop_codon:yes gene_type:complete